MRTQLFSYFQVFGMYLLIAQCLMLVRAGMDARRYCDNYWQNAGTRMKYMLAGLVAGTVFILNFHFIENIWGFLGCFSKNFGESVGTVLYALFITVDFCLLFACVCGAMLPVGAVVLDKSEID